MTVTNELGNWIEITLSDKKGWICKAVIQNTEPSNETADNSVSEPTKPTSETTPEETVPEETEPEENNNQTENKKGYVNSDTVNVRKAASTDSERIGFLDLNDEVEILAEEGDWYKINTKKYGECYIAKRLISLTKVSSRGDNVERESTVSQEENEKLEAILNNSGNEIANFANQYLGYSYVSGGKTPNTGFDCSGFTKYVYSNFGITLGSTAASQANNSGTAVSREDLQPGDLILFQDDAKTKIGHCGIYIGDNTFIHAANPNRGVVTDKLEGNSYYSPRYVSAYRF
ncbi:MAG: NlpC/P60 family protein [Candidatus Scatovivens sp.]